jgi:hypothetical protein
MDEKEKTNKMKVIFLDFDGVICTSDSIIDARTFAKVNKDGDRNLYHEKMIDPKLVENLNKVIDETQAFVVISSAWRNSDSLDTLKMYLENNGFCGIVIGRTPVWKEYKEDIGIKTINDLQMFWEHERGNEINLWLSENKNVDSYIIIDDELSDIEPLHEGRFIHTSLESGFHEGLIQEAITKLKGECNGRNN